VAGTLSTPPDDAEVLRYRANLAEVRKVTAARALRAGLSPGRANDLVIAVAELAANTLIHTSGPGTLTIWVTDEEVICQVQDQGQITDPQAGMVRPAPDAPGGGRGLWVVHQVCDQVEISTGQAGTTVRVHMMRSPRSAGGPSAARCIRRGRWG
jgi:anti-sigma regulatory factor (Ser/Thr protein kinase)